jgi:hypothetical protein
VSGQLAIRFPTAFFPATDDILARAACEEIFFGRAVRGVEKLFGSFD